MAKKKYLERAVDGVSVEYLAYLLERDDLLSHLEASGVDNWEWYSTPDDDDDEDIYGDGDDE